MPAGRSIPLGSLLLALALVVSCRSTPLGPSAGASESASTPLDALDPGNGLHVTPTGVQTPVIRDMQGEVRGDTLQLRAHFEPFASRTRRPYDPSRPGGWILQLFMNTD